MDTPDQITSTFKEGYRDGYARPNHLKSPQLFKRGIEMDTFKSPQLFKRGIEIDTPDQITSNHLNFLRGVSRLIRQTKPPQITSTF